MVPNMGRFPHFHIWGDTDYFIAMPESYCRRDFLYTGIFFLQLGDFSRFRFVPYMEVVRRFFKYPTFKCPLDLSYSTYCLVLGATALSFSIKSHQVFVINLFFFLDKYLL